MRTFDVFSRRHPGGITDKRDELGQATRNRILLLYRNTVSGTWEAPPDPDAGMLWLELHTSLQYLHGRTGLSKAMSNKVVGSHQTVLRDIDLFLQECSTEEFLDSIELSFKANHPPASLGNSKTVIDALNEILKIDAAPYRLTDFVRITEQEIASPFPGIPTHEMTLERVTSYPTIIKVEEDIVYREALEPALTTLSVKPYSVPNSEFRKGLEHYRNGEFRESLTGCGSALESVLKVMCAENGWSYQQTDTLGELLDNVVPRLGLEPFLKENFKILASIRNRFSSSHGGGTSAREPERSLAQYMITTTAATIVLIVTTAESKKRSP